MDLRAEKSTSSYFSLFELILWFCSLAITVIAFLLFDQQNWLAFSASLIGVTSLILCAKGNPAGQVLIIVFSILYGIISWRSQYYGEMFTYLGMTTPMAVVALVAWLRHPFDGNYAEVTVGRLKVCDASWMLLITAIVTLAFYFVLRALHTARLVPSTISVTTSFLAVWLTYKRSEYFALAYAANDVVLIVLWMLATAKDISNISVLICFAVFLINDLYGFINWKTMRRRQERQMQPPDMKDA